MSDAPTISADERRSEARHAYPFPQQYAPVFDGLTPPKSKFRPAAFRDVSAHGASFVVDARPAFDAVVIELGAGENVSHQLARIVRVERIDGEGATQFLIACRFERPVQI